MSERSETGILIRSASRESRLSRLSRKEKK